jgi:hypothetical protein
MIGFTFFGANFIPFGIFNSHDLDFTELLVPFLNPVNVGIIAIAAVLVILIPILVIVYGLFKALFRFKAKDKSIGMSAFTIWLLALIVLVTLVILEGKNFNEGETVSSTTSLSTFTGDTLYLQMDKSELSRLKSKDKINLDDQWYILNNGEYFYGEVEVDIEKSRSSEYEIRIVKGSIGSNEEEAGRIASEIEYSYDLEGSNLVLDPYFKSDLDNKWRIQTLRIYVYIPEDKAVHFDRNTASFLDGIYNLDHYSNYRMAGKTWIMREDGLESTNED